MGLEVFAQGQAQVVVICLSHHFSPVSLGRQIHPSSVNLTPKCSSAALMALRLFVSGVRAPLSKSVSVLVAMPACLASVSLDRSSPTRAARHSRAVIILLTHIYTFYVEHARCAHYMSTQTQGRHIMPFSFTRENLNLTYSINGNVNFPFDVIRDSLDAWAQIAPFTFTEVSGDADIIYVDLGELISFTPGYTGALGLSVTYTDAAGQPFLSYVGLDASAIAPGAEGWVSAHETGHAVFGFVDTPAADPDDTIMSYTQGSGLPQAGDIAKVQAVYDASPDDNIIFGGAGSGPISGGAGADLIYGNQGADILYGNQGGDILYGGQGDDVLYGGQGDDILAGNNGSDTLWGGQGADTFVGVDADMIADFDPAQGDVIWGWWV